MGDGEGGLIAGSGEQAPWQPLLATQPTRSFPAARQSWELGRAALVMSLSAVDVGELDEPNNRLNVGLGCAP